MCLGILDMMKAWVRRILLSGNDSRGNLQIAGDNYANVD